MNKKVLLCGIGNCGSQVTLLAEKKYPTLFDCVYINSSESDLSMVDTANDSLKFKIGEIGEVEGSGKNRAKMKEYLKKDIKTILGNSELQDLVKDKRYCYIIASAAGGTGSGAAPVLLEIMRKMFPDTNFILVTVLPQIGASLMEQGNALEFLDELYKVLDGSRTTYMIYDNESVVDLPPTKGLETVNDNIVEDIRILTGIDNYPTPYESIDEADMESIISTPGRLLVTRVTKRLTEKSMEDNSLDEIVIKSIKQSCHCETDRNKKVMRWGIITYFTDEVNKLYSSELPKVLEFIGTPVERFNHNAINDKNETFNFMYLIAAGMSPINDRVKRIKDRVEELKNALASDSANKYILESDDVTYEALALRKKEEKRSESSAEVSISDIFSKFEQ